MPRGTAHVPDPRFRAASEVGITPACGESKQWAVVCPLPTAHCYFAIVRMWVTRALISTAVNLPL